MAIGVGDHLARDERGGVGELTQVVPGQDGPQGGPGDTGGAGGWLSEKAGRLKPNGRVVRRSGLSTLVELEALRIGVEGKAMLWHTLLDAADHDTRLEPDRLTELLGRARRQRTVLESLHDTVAAALFAPGQQEERESAVNP
ncbi:hypothetical protein ABZ370_22340 [Streptomyces sp. NPDC005962]|uniref:hypothetical protein n=1 Tax=Streptomyces sp. NPDC005962 TaxID=3154466 RepID=UPI0033E1C0C4